MNRSFLIIAAGAVLCSMAACKSTKVTVDNMGNVKTSNLTETENVIQQVFFGEWTAVNVGGKAVEGENRPYIIFAKEEKNPFEVKCYANDGCNIVNGEFAVTPGGKMKGIGDFISTMKMCPDAIYEMGFNLALKTVENYSIEKVGRDYLLYFKDGAGQTTMIMRKSDIGFINGAWQVTRVYGKDMTKYEDLQLVIDLPEGRIHGNVGCNTMNGSVVANPDMQNSITFKDMATTRMMCPDIAIEQSLLDALGKVSTVVSADDNNTAILKDASGQEAVVLKKLNLK